MEKLNNALIIIESPNKIAKIKKVTGAQVIATVGHFMDLKEIDVENNYKPTFDYNPSKKSSMMKAIESAKGKNVYIASDPDREGYAIGYMFYQKVKNVAKSVYRAEFHEITPSGIEKGIKEAKLFVDTNQNYYQSFLGRRCADMLIGFLLSPLLAKGLNTNGLSAGRVQTPCLLLIVKREEDIKAFNSLSEEEKKEYAINAIAGIDGKDISFKHIEDGKEIKFPTKQEAEQILSEIKDLQQGLIKKIEKTTAKSTPPKPFTTSKLLKTASKKLGISTKEITSSAQRLFEKGLITYIRTDSEYISEEFLKEAEAFWKGIYPNTYQYTEYKAGKNSQAEAHEAIRITHPHKYEDLKSIVENEKLDKETQNDRALDLKLYEIIFKNTLLSQSKPAEYEKTNVFLMVKNTEFKTSFKKLINSGYLGVFNDKDDDEQDDEEVSSFPFAEGDMLPLKAISIRDINKQCPKRYLEADFIEVLEKTGIGRPSTYASFLPILTNREYITISQDKKREIAPTPLGMGVINFFRGNSNNWILNLNFTKEMEDFLDEITKGEKKYLDFIKTIHSQMGNIPLNRQNNSENKEKKQYPPSEAQIKFAKDIAQKLGIGLPNGYEQDYRIVSDFISKHKDKAFSKSK